MKSMHTYLLGYFVVVGGLSAAAWKLGLLDRIGPVWAAIGIVIVMGLGIMLSVSMGATKTVEIEKEHQ